MEITEYRKLNPAKKRRTYPERDLQMQVCNYIRARYPDVIFFCDMSGVNLRPAQAGIQKMMRSSRGIPDLIIFEPRGEYHGLLLELKPAGFKLKKKDGNYATEHIKEQAGVMLKLRNKHYLSGFGIGFENIAESIDYYMKLK